MQNPEAPQSSGYTGEAHKLFMDMYEHMVANPDQEASGMVVDAGVMLGKLASMGKTQTDGSQVVEFSILPELAQDRLSSAATCRIRLSEKGFIDEDTTEQMKWSVDFAQNLSLGSSIYLKTDGSIVYIGGDMVPKRGDPNDQRDGVQFLASQMAHYFAPENVVTQSLGNIEDIS